jgi:hypothetical protein
MLIMPFIYAVIVLLLVLGVAWLSKTYIPMPDGIRPVVDVVLALIVVGMVMYFINTYIPMAGAIRAILNIVVFLATCVGVLKALDLWDSTVRLWSGFRSRLPGGPSHLVSH